MLALLVSFTAERGGTCKVINTFASIKQVPADQLQQSRLKDPLQPQRHELNYLVKGPKPHESKDLVARGGGLNLNVASNAASSVVSAFEEERT